MSSLSLKQFQDQVSDLLLRHRSLLDVLSKLHQSGASIDRSVVKAVTECGCLELRAAKQNYTAEMSIKQAKEAVDSHVHGRLCEPCTEIVISEIGKHLFYVTSLCNILDLDLEHVVGQESKKCSTLGFFNLS